jgi:hypothetical protein
VKRSPTSREQLLRVTADGVDLIHSSSDQTYWSVRWAEVDEIIAFKIDTITFDRLCMAFRRHPDGTYLATDEETPGWKELNDQLLHTFGVSFDSWFPAVAFPPFAENRTTLWSRDVGGSFAPAAPLHETSTSPLHSFEVAFEGAVLRRGFWLYIVEIRTRERVVTYVGRTGDTSSPNAGSLFSRIASHLNRKKSAKGNALLRNLHNHSLPVEECAYRFIGIGPIFPQQQTMASHIPIRDEMAGLERAVADILRQRGYDVLGEHPKRRPVRPELLTAVLRELDRLLPGAG